MKGFSGISGLVAGVALCGNVMLVAPSNGPECQSVVDRVTASGLTMSANFELKCPDSSIPYWGLTTWYGSDRMSTIQLNLDSIHAWGMSPEFVLAHEYCHAIELDANGVSQEDQADACAEAHGWQAP